MNTIFIYFFNKFFTVYPVAEKKMMKTNFKLTYILLFNFCDNILCLIFLLCFILQLYNALIFKIKSFIVYCAVFSIDGSNFCTDIFFHCGILSN